jgi:hypothetical protein
MESKWKGRKNKTIQDQMAMGERERVREWDRRKSWAQAHHPKSGSDWLAYRSK